MRIDGATRVIAHLGFPTHAFKAPMIYNPYFESVGVNAVVVPMGCRPESFPKVLRSLFLLENIAGALITMPHKVSTVGLLDEVSRTARIAGACNAVKRTPQGKLVGDMFDGEGFVRGITHKGFRVDGASALVAGSGGVGSAIAASLAAAGAAHLALYDVHAATANALAARIGQEYPQLRVTTGSNDPAGFDLVVNGTPLGMNPGDPLPMDVSRLDARTFVGEGRDARGDDGVSRSRHGAGLPGTGRHRHAVRADSRLPRILRTTHNHGADPAPSGRHPLLDTPRGRTMSELQVLSTSREPLQASFGDESNPLGLAGIEFIEYATLKPQALGQVLEMMGFRPVARHRSREVTLYRQGSLNVVVNADPMDAQGAGHGSDVPAISAIAVRVRDARAAHRFVLERGGWDVPGHPDAMELNIPAIHGVGGSRVYFVDRWRDFSIYDVDFVPIPSVERNPPAVAGIHFFGIVQYIGLGRTSDWIEFYQELFGAALIPDEERFGIMPRGKLLRTPSPDAGNSFMLQLVEPDVDAIDARERFQRIGLGVPDVLAAVRTLRESGMEFVESEAAHTGQRGAISKTYLGGIVFELVHSEAT